MTKITDDKGKENMKKYEMTDITKTVEFNGREVVLHRIRAITESDYVRAGDEGGWIEKEENLSQTDDSWVGGEAMVMYNARVTDGACVYENAIINDYAIICGRAQIYGNAVVSGHAVVDASYVYENALVKDYSKVTCSIVHGNATIKGYAQLNNNTDIFGNAVVRDYARLEYSLVYGNALIEDQAVVGIGVRVYGRARIYGKSEISVGDNGAKGIICDNASISGSFINSEAGFYIGGNSCISIEDIVEDRVSFADNAIIRNFRDYAVLTGMNDEFEEHPLTFYHDKEDGISVSIYGNSLSCPLGKFCGECGNVLALLHREQWYHKIPLRLRRNLACEALGWLGVDYEVNVC